MMMHSTAHYALGLLLAAAWQGPALRRAWREGRPLARLLGRHLLTAHALGLLAIAPNLLRRVGLSLEISEGPLMNVFLFAPLLNRVFHGGTIWGPAVLGLMLAAQYGLLLLALRRAGRAP